MSDDQVCEVTGCDEMRVRRRRFCRLHQSRHQRYGDPLATPRPIGRPPTPARVRFDAKVREGDVPEYAPHLGPCLIWTGAKTTYPSGQYGRFRDDDSRMVMTHRWNWEQENGPTDAQAMDHLCRVTLCVRPSHLEPVTDRENVLRSPVAIPAVNARKTCCPRGHEYDAVWQGRRYCKRCRREQLARNYRDRLARQAALRESASAPEERGQPGPRV